MHAAPHTYAVGTYTEKLAHVAGEGQGIHLISLDPATAQLRLLASANDIPNPSYLCTNRAGTRLYAVSERAHDAALAVYALAPHPHAAPALSLLQVRPLAGADPCHVSLHEDAGLLCVSHYGSGELLCLRTDDAGLPTAAAWAYHGQGSGPVAARQEASHLHCALATSRGIVACDLGTDRITLHAPHGDGAPVRTWTAAPGAGPRHALAHAGRLYVVNELDNTVSAYDPDAPGGGPYATTALPEQAGAAAGAAAPAAALPAALHAHPNGRWLYASIRGVDRIALLHLDGAGRPHLAGDYDAGGRTPRDFALSHDGAFLLSAAQDEHRIRVHAIAADSGALQPVGVALALASPACICPIPR